MTVLQNYKLENDWVFVRGEAFGFKVGVVVKLDESRSIQEIEYKSAL